MSLEIQLLLVIVSTFLPGYLCYRRWLHRADDDAATALSASFICGVLLICAVAFIALLTGRPTTTTDVLLYLLTLWAMTWGGTRVEVRWLGLFVTYVLFSMMALELLKLMPSYQAAYTLDWSLYYPNISFYLGHVAPSSVTDALRFEYLTKRTPFFSLYNAFFLNFSGESYAAYQITSLALNALVLFSVVGALSRFFDRRTARVALLALPLTPLMFYGVVIPTPKSVSAFGVLTAAFAYARLRADAFAPAHRRDRWLCALAAATVYMCHPSAIVYLMVLAADQAMVVIRGRKWPAIGAAFGPLAAAAVIVLPWFIWAVATFGSDRVFVPTYTISQQHLTATEYVTSRVMMLATTMFVPATLFHGVVDGVPDATRPWIVGLSDPTVRFYWETFLGGMTVTATLCGAVAWLMRRRALPSGFRLLLGWTATGALGTILVHLLVDLEGNAANVMTPLAVLWFVALWATLASAPRALRAVALAGVAAEFAVALRLVYRVTSAEPPVFHYLSSTAGILQGRGLAGFVVVLVAVAIGWGTGVFSTETAQLGTGVER